MHQADLAQNIRTFVPRFERPKLKRIFGNVEQR